MGLTQGRQMGWIQSIQSLSFVQIMRYTLYSLTVQAKNGSSHMSNNSERREDQGSRASDPENSNCSNSDSICHALLCTAFTGLFTAFTGLFTAFTGLFQCKLTNQSQMTLNSQPQKKQLPMILFDASQTSLIAHQFTYLTLVLISWVHSQT